MPGPNSTPKPDGKTAKTRAKSARNLVNRHACAIRDGGGKFRGVDSCHKHKGDK